MSKHKLTEDSISVKCPIKDSNIKNVLINPLAEEVIWNYAYVNGEKVCYGYQIRNKIKDRRGISD